VKIWCQFIRDGEIDLGFVDFEDAKKNSSSVSGSSISSISICNADESAASTTKGDHKNEIEGFDLQGNLVTIVSGNYSCKF